MSHRALIETKEIHSDEIYVFLCEVHNYHSGGKIKNVKRKDEKGRIYFLFRVRVLTLRLNFRCIFLNEIKFHTLICDQRDCHANFERKSIDVIKVSVPYQVMSPELVTIWLSL